MIIARFDIVCGRKITNYGIFDDTKIMMQEYDIIKNLNKNKINNEIEQCFYRRNIGANKSFVFGEKKFVLVEPIKDIEYNIDKINYEDYKDYEVKKGDMLLIDLTPINDEEIEFSYLIRNKFICYDESHNYFDIDDFIKYYPYIDI